MKQNLDDLKTWRLIPSTGVSGSANMALDAALLHYASRDDFPPTVRFMRWEPPALSLGRFQPVGQVNLEACDRAGVDVVRRATGGEAVLHKDEFTYTVVLPRRMQKPDSVIDAYEMICDAIVAAFGELGLEIALLRRDIAGEGDTEGSCFARPGTSDLVYRGAKICGSAQARKDGALLQHGSVLIGDNAALLYGMLELDADARVKAEEKFRRGCVCLEEIGLEVTRGQLEQAFLAGIREMFCIDFEQEPPADREYAWVSRHEREFLIACRGLRVTPDASLSHAHFMIE